MPFASLSTASDKFPTYLISSLPFHRRKSSSASNAWSARSDSIASIDSEALGTTPPRETYLAGHASHLRCSRCLSDLALASQIISKGFTGRHGRAYLVAPSTSSITQNPIGLMSPKAKNDALPNLPNTFTHKPVPRQLVTGAHTVSDISCSQCGSNLGWKYVAADEESQRYKVGKFILETKRVCRSSTWETSDVPEEELDLPDGIRRDLQARSAALPPDKMPSAFDGIEFNSEDEDECEDLFMGAWTPQAAARRRRLKRHMS